MSKELSNEKYFYDSENVQKFSPELKKLWNRMFECREEIELILRSRPSFAGKGYWGFAADVPVAAYLIATSKEYNDLCGTDYKKVLKHVSQNLAKVASSNEIEASWDDLLKLRDKYETGVFYLVAILRDLSDPAATPESITTLARKILDVKDSDVFADYCCGAGSVALTVRRDAPKAEIYGYEINEDSEAVAELYSELNHYNIHFENRDAFELMYDSESKKKFTKIFANYPFGLKLNYVMSGKLFIEQLEKKIPSISKATSSDWLFNMLIVETLAEGGKAVGIMTNGSTWNQIDREIRKYFVEEGLIECVIALPNKMFPPAAVATSLVVFSHNNEGVRLVDATEMCETGRRSSTFSSENIDDIMAATKNDTENSMFITLEQLRDNDYVLNKSRYTDIFDDIKDGAKFDSVIKRITRGAQLNAKDLDDLSSQTPTGMQYLMLANVQNGLIDKELPYLKAIDKKNEKYCLSNRCLILSKNGYPYKIAVAEISEGQKILANGNLYIIEIDETKADPYYIAAFLNSELGTAALKSITVGATIPNIGVDQLKNLIIPIPKLDEQKEIASKYITYRDEITLLQLKLEKAKNKMAHILEEGGNE